MCVPNFSSLAGLEVAEKFVWGVGWGGLHSHFHVKPNRCVEVRVRVRVGVLTIIQSQIKPENLIGHFTDLFLNCNYE